MIHEPRMQAPPQAEPDVMHYAPSPTVVPTGRFAMISWGGLVAGTVAAMATQVLLAVLGIAVGTTVAQTDAATAQGMGIGAGIWWVLASIIALFVGGWIAARCASVRDPADGAIHGALTWALVTVLSLLFIAGAGTAFAGGALGEFAGFQSQQLAQPLPGTTGEAVADTAMGAAWWTFFAMLLGAGAAGFGGFIATPKEIRSRLSGRAGAGLKTPRRE